METWVHLLHNPPPHCDELFIVHRYESYFLFQNHHLICIITLRGQSRLLHNEIAKNGHLKCFLRVLVILQLSFNEKFLYSFRSFVLRYHSSTRVESASRPLPSPSCLSLGLLWLDKDCWESITEVLSWWQYPIHIWTEKEMGSTSGRMAAVVGLNEDEHLHVNAEWYYHCVCVCAGRSDMHVCVQKRFLCVLFTIKGSGPFNYP